MVILANNSKINKRDFITLFVFFIIVASLAVWGYLINNKKKSIGYRNAPLQEEKQQTKTEKSQEKFQVQEFSSTFYSKVR